jgi:hypothetical protein
LNNKTLKENSYLLLIIFTPLAFTYFINAEKKATFSTLFIIFFLLIHNKYFKNNKNILTSNISSSKRYFFSYLILLIFTFTTQNVYLNFETIEWDIASYLVASQEIDRGFIPNETQWESKGPLFFYLYNFFKTISLNNLIFFRLLNDFILFVISIFLFKTLVIRTSENKIKSLGGALLFIGLMSQPWAVSEYSELYSLFFISLSYFIFNKFRGNKKMEIVIGLLISFSTLINQGTLLFLLPYFIYIYFQSNAVGRLIKFRTILISFVIPHLFSLAVYIFNGIFDIYIATYVLIPLGYIGETFSNFYELKVFSRSIFEFNQYLYFSLISILTLASLNALSNIKTQSQKMLLNLDYWFIFISISFYFIGSHNYYHHLIFLMYFICFLTVQLTTDRQIYYVCLLIFISSMSLITNSYSQSFENLMNIDQVYENYPLRELSAEIDSYFEEDYTVLALNYVLVLHYLDKPNYSYIVHPSNHFEKFITDVLIDLERIDSDHISSMLNSEPDVIICNNKMIIRGEPTKIDTYNCAVDDYNGNYIKLETSKYEMNPNLLYYKDPYRQISVFILNK